MNTELRRRSPKPRRSPSPAQTRQTQEPNTLCWYHRKFGDAGVKLPGRSLEATSVTGQTPLGRLLYITDQSSGTRFLVDTGPEVSVIHPRAGDRKCTMDSLILQAVNNTPIPTYGTRSLTLNLGLRQWVFVIADVQRPIIGADFLVC